MKLLTNENKPFDTNNIPNDVLDLRYCILDYTEPTDVDFYFVPLMFLESFTSTSALVQIGQYTVQLPLDWSIVIGDKEVGDLEVLEIHRLNDRPMSAFVFNPLSSFYFSYLDIHIIDVFSDVKWYMPQLQTNHILTVPLGEKNQWVKSRNKNESYPECCYIIRDVNKLPDVLNITHII